MCIYILPILYAGFKIAEMAIDEISGQSFVVCRGRISLIEFILYKIRFTTKRGLKLGL